MLFAMCVYIYMSIGMEGHKTSPVADNLQVSMCGLSTFGSAKSSAVMKELSDYFTMKRYQIAKALRVSSP